MYGVGVGEVALHAVGDDAPDLARRFDVMSIPTLILFNEGQPAKRLVGATGKAQLLDELAEFL